MVVINPSYFWNDQIDLCKKMALTIFLRLEFKLKSISCAITRAPFVFILLYCIFTFSAEMVAAESMVAWELTKYGSAVKPIVTDAPEVKNGHDVLVRVTAASVSPLDVSMIDGYGKVLLNTLRGINRIFPVKPSELPLILGRDFVGVVAGKGKKVTSVEIGDTVMGVTEPHQQGSHAEYVLATDYLVIKKPEQVSNEEGASLLYAGLTAWSALRNSGLLNAGNCKNKNVLVLGASGGVGTIFVQLLKNWEAIVVATCSKSAIPVVSKLNPNFILDYTDPNFLDDLSRHGPYDVILDAAGINPSDYNLYTKNLKKFSFSTMICLNPTILPNTDKYGFILGSMKTMVDLVSLNIFKGPTLSLRAIKWGFFAPYPEAIQALAKLAEERKVVPVIEGTYSFSKTPEAYARVKEGHLRGKVVILVDDADKLRTDSR